LKKTKEKEDGREWYLSGEKSGLGRGQLPKQCGLAAVGPALPIT
jgi:hypothetical protein